jgi:hypothetical protein
MLESLFQYDDFDIVDEFCIQFYDCMLMQDIGTRKECDTVDIITVDFRDGTILFYSNDDDEGIPLWKGNFEYKII